MSDSSKAEKIAAAKKKLKQFQSKAKTETTSGNVQSPDSNEYESNTNGDRNQQESIQFYQQSQLTTPSPPPPPPPSSSLQSSFQQSINLHFGAIDPVQFDSSKIFDTSQIPGNFYNQSEMGLNSVQQYSMNNNSAKMPTASIAPPPPILQPETTTTLATPNLPQPSTEAIPHSSIIYQHQQYQYQTDPSAAIAETVNDSAKFQRENQELNDLLQVERLRNHELSVKVTQQHSTIEGLSIELNELRKSANTIAALQQQVNTHIQTVNMLVGEKSDLIAKLQQRDQRITDYESEAVELQGRLKASRHRVAELEKDFNTLAQSHQKYDGSQQVLCTELETLQEENKNLKRMHQETCDENAEARHQLVQKIKEIDELKANISVKNSELEMAHVRLEQLTGGDAAQALASTTHAEHTPQDQQRLLDAERQVIELQNMISDLTNDRDRTQQQYQTYVQHLTSETATFTQRIQELTRTNEKLTKREESLVNHVQELEKQIQKQLSTQRRLAALRDEEESAAKKDSENVQNANDVLPLHEKLQAIEKEKSDLNALLQDHSTQKLMLQQQLLEKDAKLTEIESELERLKADRPDTTNLLASIESDKVAASRAMMQNQELRKQLEEMQHAFVQVSNDKLELASQLQSEEYLNRDVRNRFGDLDTELKSIKEKLHFKDEEMIRLTHENAHNDAKIQELQKKLDTNSNDSVRQVTEIQKKLHIANKEIYRLRQKLQNQSKPSDGDTRSNNGDEGSGIEIGSTETDSQQIKSKCAHEHDDHDHDHDHEHCNHPLDDDAAHETGSTLEAFDNSDVVSVTSTINIATNEAMDKLQNRFKRTMNEIADLTEEKSRLEHLVTQLQSETETIGEYIALYQTQRRLLKQRETEKDMQLNRIAADRESMRDKLRQLNELVELLLEQKGFSNAKEIMAKLNTTDNLPAKNSLNGSNTPTEHAPHDNAENSCHHQQNIIHEGDGGVATIDADNGQKSANEHIHNHSHHTVGEANTRETATKIINLLTDIKEKNLRQDYTVEPNQVDHCSCCSGKLEVV